MLRLCLSCSLIRVAERLGRSSPFCFIKYREVRPRLSNVQKEFYGPHGRERIRRGSRTAPSPAQTTLRLHASIWRTCKIPSEMLCMKACKWTGFVAPVWNVHHPRQEFNEVSSRVGGASEACDHIVDASHIRVIFCLDGRRVVEDRHDHGGGRPAQVAVPAVGL